MSYKFLAHARATGRAHCAVCGPDGPLIQTADEVVVLQDSERLKRHRASKVSAHRYCARKALGGELPR